MAVVDPTEVATAFSDLLAKEVRRCELFGRKLLQGSHYLGGCGGLAAGGEKGEAIQLAGLGANGLAIGE